MGEKSVLLKGAGIAELVVTITSMCRDIGDAAAAYAKKTVAELRILENHEVSALQLDVTLLDLTDRKQGLQKKRAKLEYAIKELERRKTALETVNTAQVKVDPKPVQRDARRGNPRFNKQRDPVLTHHMELPPIGVVLAAHPVEEPQAQVSLVQPAS